MRPEVISFTNSEPSLGKKCTKVTDTSTALVTHPEINHTVDVARLSTMDFKLRMCHQAATQSQSKGGGGGQ